jgi:hypothetical protein
MGLRTYEDIEKYLELENRKKDDKKMNFFESCGIGTKINRFLRANNEFIDSNEKEKQLVKKLGITKSTYYDIKRRILKEALNEKDPKGKI